MDTAADHHATAAPPSPGSPTGDVLLELIREVRSQREGFEAAQAKAALERKAERRWKMLFQGLFFGAPVVLGLLYFLFFLSTAGFRWGPFGDVVGIVRINGPIAANSDASADKIVPALQKAFANGNVKAVVLSIDSPGGSPVESERIYDALAMLRKRFPKPAVAVIHNLGASAAYMIAIHADKIIAGKYSLVGSIGAVMAPWQLDRAIARFDVAQHVYASGPLKAFLNPFSPMTPEVDAKAHQLVDQMGRVFLAEVRAARGQRLTQGVDFGTGEIWSGSEAFALGLVDSVGTLDEYVDTRWGLKPYDFGPGREGLDLLSSSLSGAFRSALESILWTGPRLS